MINISNQELKDLVFGLANSMKELRVSQAQTDKQIQELKVSQAQTDKQIEETGKQMKETDRKLESIGIQLGNMSKNQGDVAEEYFVNSLKDKLSVAGIKFDALLSNVALQTKKINDEFDILLVNGDSLAIIEVKYKVHPKDVEKLAKKIEHIKIMPSYKNYKIYAGIAGFKVPSDAIELAYESGYFALQRKGDTIETYASNLKVA